MTGDRRRSGHRPVGVGLHPPGEVSADESLFGRVGQLQSTAGNRATAVLLSSQPTGVQRLPDRRRPSHHNNGLMRRGSRGPAVRALQQRLGVAADGIFGEQTRAAVQRVQQGAGISADGIVGPATRAALAGGSAAVRHDVPPTQGAATAALIAQRLGAIVARLRQLGSEAVPESTNEAAPEPPDTEVVDETIARDDWLDDAGDWYDETTEAAGEAWDETSEFVEETVDDVSEAAGEVWDETTEFVEETVDDVSEAAGEVWDETTEFVEETVDDVSEAAGEVWDATTDFVGDVVDQVRDVADEVWDDTTDFVGDVVDQVRDVADEVFDTIDQLADSVRDMVADPIGTLSEIVSDLMGGGPSADIFERLTEVWNGLFGGNDDEAETTGSGTVPSVGPTAVAHSCPRGDDLQAGRPMSLNVQIDWGPPAIDGPSSEASQRGIGRDDKLQTSVNYRGFISQTLPAANIPGFGREEPSLTVESIHWDQSDGVVEVHAYARLDCRWGINAHGRIDIPNADVPAIDDVTWSHVIDDLTPGGDDKPPREMYWASDATSAHEYYHAIDDYGAGQSMVDSGDAVSTVNNRQIVDPEAELPAIMQEIHARIYQHLQDHYRSGGEARAYGATAPIFHERVAAIRARAEREGWT